MKMEIQQEPNFWNDINNCRDMHSDFSSRLGFFGGGIFVVVK